MEDVEMYQYKKSTKTIQQRQKYERSAKNPNKEIQQLIKPLKECNKKKEKFDSVDPNNPFQMIKIERNQQDSECFCDVCLDGDDSEGDEIVICELCLAATH